MKKTVAILLVLMVCMSLLAGCGGGGRQSSGVSPSAGADTPAGPDASGEGGGTQVAEGERISIAIENEDAEEGALSAIIPADWKDYSDETFLVFSEAEDTLDFTKPYVRIHYSYAGRTNEGDGEEVSFDAGGMTWTGLYDETYNTYNLVHISDDGSGIGVVSSGVGPDDAVFEMVVGSILVEF